MSGAQSAGVPGDVRGALFSTIVGAAAGASAAAVVSIAGHRVFDNAQAPVGLLVGMCLTAGLFDVLSLGRSLGRNRETVSRHRSWVRWSTFNSIEMSVFLRTRPGSASLYLLLGILFIAGHWWIGILSGFIYGAVRSSAHVTLRKSVRRDHGIRLLQRRQNARRALGLLSIAIGLVFLAA